MSKEQHIQQLLSEAGIEFEEVFTGQGRDCPVCGCEHQLAA